MNQSHYYTNKLLSLDESQQRKEKDEEMGPWKYSQIPQYLTLQPKTERKPKPIESMKKKLLKQKAKNNVSLQLQIQQKVNKKSKKSSEDLKLPYLKNYSERLANLDFISGSMLLMKRDNLNFIKRRKNDKSPKTKRRPREKQTILDKSQVIKSNESVLKLSKKISAQSSRYNIYEQCVTQLRNRSQLQEQIKKQYFSK